MRKPSGPPSRTEPIRSTHTVSGIDLIDFNDVYVTIIGQNQLSNPVPGRDCHSENHTHAGTREKLNKVLQTPVYGFSEITSYRQTLPHPN